MVEIATAVRYNHPMASETTQSSPTVPEMNSIKNKMAVTFLHALNSTVNYSMQESSREFDNIGLDFALASQTVGSKRTVSSGANTIFAQLKGVATSSTSMFSETDADITYRLKEDLLQFGATMYLIVVVLPADEDFENWRVINDNDVLLNARGYYTKVETRLPKGRIKIPKTQQLTPETFRRLFDASSIEVEV